MTPFDEVNSLRNLLYSSLLVFAVTNWEYYTTYGDQSKCDRTRGKYNVQKRQHVVVAFNGVFNGVVTVAVNGVFKGVNGLYY